MTEERARVADMTELTEAQILVWADLHYRRTGHWPNKNSGPVFRVPSQSWARIDKALSYGRQGLPGGSSLARLLLERRGVRHKGKLPRLTIRLLLQWADAHHARFGHWPTSGSGPISEAPGETWAIVNQALTHGLRGLPGGSSLPCLLQEHRPARHRLHPPHMTEAQILTWADAHHAQTGKWPTQFSGPVLGVPGETWKGLNHALRLGYRGLAGGSSLAHLLHQARGVRNVHELPDYTEEQILAWADAHHARTGQWPRSISGPIEGAEGETWKAVEMALVVGRRGLAGGSSLYKLLARCRPTPQDNVSGADVRIGDTTEGR
jgi:hypothetical protein